MYPADSPILSSGDAQIVIAGGCTTSGATNCRSICTNVTSGGLREISHSELRHKTPWNVYFTMYTGNDYVNMAHSERRSPKIADCVCPSRCQHTTQEPGGESTQRPASKTDRHISDLLSLFVVKLRWVDSAQKFSTPTNAALLQK